LVDWLPACQRPRIFGTSFFLDFDGRAARATLGDVEGSVDGGVGAAVGRDCDKRRVTGTTAASGCIGNRPSIYIISAAEALLVFNISDQWLQSTHLFVRYAVTLPEVGVGGGAVEVELSTDVAVVLAALVVVDDMEVENVELAIVDTEVKNVELVVVDREVHVVELVIGVEVYEKLVVKDAYVAVKDESESGEYLPPPPPPPRNCGAAIVLDKRAKIAPRRIATLILDRLFSCGRMKHTVGHDRRQFDSIEIRVTYRYSIALNNNHNG
jgi:hypothetical protein